MDKKLKSILSGAGFYAALAVCLLVVAVGGWFMLMRRDNSRPVVDAAPPVQPAVSPAPEVFVPEDVPETVETLSPEPMVEDVVPTMPELPVEDAEPVVAEAPRLIVSPLNGEVLMAFSVDQLVYSPTLADWRTHDGVDISAKPGTTVLSASSGTVSAVRDDPLMGTTVVIDHDGGYQTTYANLQATPTVAVGDTVSAGQIIGSVGDTAAAEAAQGPHLHFAVSKDGSPVDPDAFLNP